MKISGIETESCFFTAAYTFRLYLTKEDDLTTSVLLSEDSGLQMNVCCFVNSSWRLKTLVCCNTNTDNSKDGIRL